MNSPLHPDPALQYAAPEREAAAVGNYSPSVPISVYRELAAELKATKALVDSLNGQNQQLTQQNQFLRQEIVRFAQSADQLRHVIESSQPMAYAPPIQEQPEFYPEEAEPAEQSSPNLAAQVTRIVKMPTPPKRPQPAPKTPPLFTEQRPERPRQPINTSSRPQEMSSLWLATTILLIVVSAFGAGFLIMKPLLGGGR